MKIAVVDSGIHAGHPHVGSVAGGVAMVGDDLTDRLGHGTAVAGAIREKAPDAGLYAVKIFDRRLSANIDTIIRALEWCVEQRMDIVNLSVGTANPDHRERVERVLTGGLMVVSVAGGIPWTIAVAADADCPRDVFRYRDGVFYASPYPRPIPGVPPERNLHGDSFAAANMTGFVAQAFGLLCPDSSGHLLAALVEWAEKGRMPRRIGA
jgi:subtilisin family serine protease